MTEKGNYTELDAAHIIRQILQGVQYLHSHGEQTHTQQHRWRSDRAYCVSPNAAGQRATAAAVVIVWRMALCMWQNWSIACMREKVVTANRQQAVQNRRCWLGTLQRKVPCSALQAQSHPLPLQLIEYGMLFMSTSCADHTMQALCTVT